MAKTRRARTDAENSHRRITRSRLRITEAETQGYPTGHLRTQSGTIEYDRGSREVGCETAITPGGCWLKPEFLASCTCFAHVLGEATWTWPCDLTSDTPIIAITPLEFVHFVASLGTKNKFPRTIRTSRKKMAIRARLKLTRRSRTKGFSHKSPRVPELKFLVAGCVTRASARGSSPARANVWRARARRRGGAGSRAELAGVSRRAEWSFMRRGDLAAACSTVPHHAKSCLVRRSGPSCGRARSAGCTSPAAGAARRPPRPPRCPRSRPRGRSPRRAR